MKERKWRYVYIPILLGVACFIVYYSVHVNQERVLIPAGFESGPIDPVNLEAIIAYWRGRAFRIGICTFLGSSFASLVLFWRGKWKSKKEGETIDC